MKIEEVISILENEKKCVEIAESGKCDRNCAKCEIVMDSKQILNAYEIAIKELEKQIPKKPTKKSFIVPHDGIDVCANCKKPLQNKSHSYCSKCGHKIDWK
jgi:hypothetical protein